MAAEEIISLSSLKLIGIAGRAGSGKSTVASFLTASYQNVYEEAFADPLKAACAAAFHLDVGHFSDPAFKNEPHNYWGVSPRKIAQYAGTELFRTYMANLLGAEVSDNFWVRTLEGRLAGILDAPPNEGYYKPGDTVIISDVRFQNEYDWIVANGGNVIHVNRSGLNEVGIPNHPSEAGFNWWNPERNWNLVNESTLEDLYAQVTKTARYLGLTLKPLENDPFPL
jgi:hypothetical protein